MIDLHQHPGHFGKTVEDILAHTQALGGRMTVLLPTNTPKSEVDATSEDCRRAAETHPEALMWFCAAWPLDVSALAHVEMCARAGAKGFGEHKVPLECDDPHSMEIYRLAGQCGLPVLIHFEEAHYNTAFARFEKVLEKFPETNFIGHAQTFWANISAADRTRSDYPADRVIPGGLTDRWLTTYPNLYADLSAGSGLNACDRDAAHYRGFIRRHGKKLIFGTDCPCRDGHGGGWEKGTCFGERMLERLQDLCDSYETFEDITEGNLKRLLKIR